MQRQLVLAHQTLLHEPPPHFVRIAAAGGFNGVTLRVKQAHPHQTPYPMLGDTPMLRETVAALKETGLFVQDIEVLRLQPHLDRDAVKEYLEAGARLGARYAGVISDDDDEARVSDHLALVAEDARAVGMRLYFEFMVYTGIKTIDQARRIVEATGRQSDINLAVDPLHLHRSGGTPDDVARLDPALLHYAQICDAPVATHSDGVAAEARDHRLLPGDGQLPLRELLRALPRDVVLVVEAPCKDLVDRVGSQDVARLAHDKTRFLVEGI